MILPSRFCSEPRLGRRPHVTALHALTLVVLALLVVLHELALHLQATNTPRARVKSHRFVRSFTLPEVLTRVDAPICVYWGTADQYYPHFLNAYDEQITAHGLEIETEIIEGAGHWAIYEAPNVMNEKLAAFFEAHD